MNCAMTHQLLEILVKKFQSKLRDYVPIDAAKDR